MTLLIFCVVFATFNALFCLRCLWNQEVLRGVIAAIFCGVFVNLTLSELSHLENGNSCCTCDCSIPAERQGD